MNVFKVGSLAGGMVVAAALAVPASAQDRDPVVRAFDLLGRGAQVGLTVTDVETVDAKEPKSGVTVETVTPGGPADRSCGLDVTVARRPEGDGLHDARAPVDVRRRFLPIHGRSACGTRAARAHASRAVASPW